MKNKEKMMRECPHCGSVNNFSEHAWLTSADEDYPGDCSNCGKPLADHVPNQPHEQASLCIWFSRKPFLIIAGLVFAILIYLNIAFDMLSLSEDLGQIAYVVVLVLIVSSFLSRGNVRRNLGYLFIWGAVFLVLMVGYTFRHEINHVKEKVFAEFNPSRGFQHNPGTISFPVSADGHFYIQAEVNGKSIKFLADTGASHIVLTPNDAKKLGVTFDDLRFDRFYQTANGVVRGSSIRIDHLKIGDLEINNIGASVNEAPMRESLLGMTFFKKLKSYEVKQDVLTLHWD